jgi:hypothetical protein
MGECGGSNTDGSLTIASLLQRLSKHEELSQEFRRVTTIDLKDLRRKVGYLEEDLRRKNNVAEHWNSRLIQAAARSDFNPPHLHLNPPQPTATKTTYKTHCDPFKYKCLPGDCESCPGAFETREENPHCEACAAAQRVRCKLCMYRTGKVVSKAPS